MKMDRRMLLRGASALAAGCLMPGRAFSAVFAPRPGEWKRHEIVTRIEIAEARGTSQVWLPLPSVGETDWFRVEAEDWTTNAAGAEVVVDPEYGARMLHARWPEGEAAPVVELRTAVAMRDRAVDLGASGGAQLDAADRALYTAGTELIPVDGIVKATAESIVAGVEGELAKARAVYDWVVENSFRDPKTRGCGIGDVAGLLESGNLGGKCADLNALFVGLSRAAGLPARDIYGVRVAPSAFGYKSIGAKDTNITKAQHCRAEVFVTGIGWIPVDPADVRKVMLEEPPGELAIDDPKVVAAREALFGSWEMNWLPYNMAHDLDLPGAEGPRLGYLMYPEGETGGERLETLDPDNFRYTITAQPMPA